MLTFRVDDMTCGHCVGTITQAVHGVDGGARVEVDLAQHLVRIVPGGADAGALQSAIAAAGYTPVPVTAAAVPGDRPKSGGCCGGCG